jgi:hypothetical protein
MKSNYEKVLSTNLPADAQHVFSEMVQDWLDTNYLNYYESSMNGSNMHIIFKSTEDTLMFEIVGLPNHLKKYIICKN